MKLNKEDYTEPCCPLDMTREPRETIPAGRAIEKLDSYLNKNDYASAERHIVYWIGEAEALGDKRGKLTMLNEYIGLCRKLGKEAEAMKSIEEALPLAKALGFDGTVTMGTTLVNAATAYKAFGKAEKAMPLYEKATVIYEERLPENDAKLGALYNNSALTACDLGDFGRAEELFTKALGIMQNVENGELEMAITYCNLADLTAAKCGVEEGEERIDAYLEKAQELLETKTLPHNGYYAFVCEKCAPTLGYYGYFAAERELKERAREIYERA